MINTLPDIYCEDLIEPLEVKPGHVNSQCPSRQQARMGGPCKLSRETGILRRKTKEMLEIKHTARK